MTSGEERMASQPNETNYESDLIRLCHTEDLDIFFNYQSRTQNFGGIFGFLTNEIVSLVRRLNNGTMSILENGGFGDPIPSKPGLYTGCIGHLQNNRSDILFYPADYPFDAENIEQGLIMYDVRFVIAQTYFLREVADDEFEILNTLLIYREIWYYLVAITIVVTAITWIRNKLISHGKRANRVLTRWIDRINIPKKRAVDLTRIVSHSYRLGAVADDTFFDKVIFITLSIFALYVVHYYASLIKTSLVVVGKPDLWRSYADMMAKKTPPYFIEGFNAQWYFKNAPKNSQRGKLWKWSMENFNYSDVIIPGTPSTFTDYAIRMMHGETVLIIDNIMARTVALAACKFRARDRKKMAPYLSSLLSSDARSKKRFEKPEYEKEELLQRLSKYLMTQITDPKEDTFMKGLIFSKFFTGKAAIEFKKRTRYFNEFGLSVKTTAIVESSDIFKGLSESLGWKTNVSELNDVDNCLGVSDIHDSVDIESIDLGRLSQLAIVASSIFSVCSLLLITECRKSKLAYLLN